MTIIRAGRYYRTAKPWYPIAYAAEAKRRITRRTHLEEIEAIAEEARLGRPMSPRERDAFVRGFHAPEYGEDIRLLAAQRLLDEEEGEG